MGDKHRIKHLKEDLGIMGYLKRQGIQNAPDLTPDEMADKIQQFKNESMVHP